MNDLILVKEKLKAELSKTQYERETYKKGTTSFSKEQVLIKDGKIDGLQKAIKIIEASLEAKKKSL